MRIYPKEYLYKPGEDAQMDASFEHGVAYGKVKLGESALFFKAMLRWYAIPFERVLRVYRRQDHVYGKLCAGGQDYDVHLLMLVLDDGTPIEVHIGDDKPMLVHAERLYAAIQAQQPQLQFGKV